MEAFVHRAAVPALFFTASADIELEAFTEAVRSSTLPERAVFDDAALGGDVLHSQSATVAFLTILEPLRAAQRIGHRHQFSKRSRSCTILVMPPFT